MRLFQAALDTPLDSPFSATLSVHGLHFTVCAPSILVPSLDPFSEGVSPNSPKPRLQCRAFDKPSCCLSNQSVPCASVSHFLSCFLLRTKLGITVCAWRSNTDCVFVIVVVIFFSLIEAPLPDPTQRTRNGPETDPKRSQTEPNGAETDRNGAEMDRNQALWGLRWDGQGVCRGGEGWGLVVREKKSLHCGGILSSGDSFPILFSLLIYGRCLLVGTIHCCIFCSCGSSASSQVSPHL